MHIINQNVTYGVFLGSRVWQLQGQFDAILVDYLVDMAKPAVAELTLAGLDVYIPSLLVKIELGMRCLLSKTI